MIEPLALQNKKIRPSREAGHLMDIGDKYYKGKPWPSWECL